MGLSTFARIFIDIAISTPLPGEVVLMVGDKPWTQLVDYEVLPFLFRQCFSTSHLATNCFLLQCKATTTWWKDANYEHLIVLASDSSYDNASQANDDSPLDEAFAVNLDEAPDLASTVHVDPTPTATTSETLFGRVDPLH